ncbi:MAG: glycerol kinase GlpK [Alphaproteobacteria bacterium]|nr:glycerol kinase GlpK [Alphaproteobacteria bacterium]
MTAERVILAIDQGTTSSRAILFDAEGRPRATAQRELPQHFPEPGWVEHDARRIWADTLEVSRQAMAEAGVGADAIAAIGITNQRETTVLWERDTGAPVANAIVWQDRRTAAACEALAAAGHGELFQARTGLLLDPYFSGTKLAWLLDNVDGARRRAAAGELAFGTVDSWLLWQLTGGRVHATDATNASRTLLFDIHAQDWDRELLSLLDIPPEVLPEVRDSSGEFGQSDAAHFGAPIPITGIAGDQQAAAFGQACVEPGMLKSTYGTGCFALVNTGAEAVRSENRLITTVAYRLGGEVSYALEGSIFVAGAAVQWLRDGLRLVGHAGESEALAAEVESTSGVYLVPAFVGLGAPYWDAEARGAILGLTRDAGIAEITRAALEAVGYQTRDLMEAMAADAGQPATAIRVDGGMVANDWLMQFLADMVALPVERPRVTETTALGAAYLAGLAVGLYPSLAAIAGQWQREARFEPRMAGTRRDALYQGWREAVDRVLTKK